MCRKNTQSEKGRKVRNKDRSKEHLCVQDSHRKRENVIVIILPNSSSLECSFTVPNIVFALLNFSLTLFSFSQFLIGFFYLYSINSLLRSAYFCFVISCSLSL